MSKILMEGTEPRGQVCDDISNVTITKNDTYVSAIYLQDCKRVGNMLSIYVVYGLNNNVPDDTPLFTISGVTMKGNGCALTFSNNAGVHGVVATNTTNNTINMLHQLGSGTSRFQMIIPCE